MTIIEKIKSFLQESEDLSIGFSELNFISADNLDDGQIGYGIDPEGNSLITGQPGSWQAGWVVIGNDNLGDPIFVACSDPDLPVYTSQHGQDEWDPTLIAKSLDSFKSILAELKELSFGRQSPNEIEENPISENDLKDFFNAVKRNNADMDIWWWETFLENDV
jgi:hypothetical protein